MNSKQLRAIVKEQKAEWQKVRFDPNWTEPIDEDIVDLCDAFNERGFLTVGSCAGHGSWPYVFLSGAMPDRRVEKLARYLFQKSHQMKKPWRAWVSKCIHPLEPTGHYWSVEIHPSNLFANTPAKKGLRITRRCLCSIARLVREFPG